MNIPLSDTEMKVWRFVEEILNWWAKHLENIDQHFSLLCILVLVSIYLFQHIYSVLYPIKRQLKELPFDIISHCVANWRIVA